MKIQFDTEKNEFTFFFSQKQIRRWTEHTAHEFKEEILKNTQFTFKEKQDALAFITMWECGLSSYQERNLERDVFEWMGETLGFKKMDYEEFVQSEFYPHGS